MDDIGRQIAPTLLVGVLLQTLISLALFAWARWVARRRAPAAWWKLVAWLPIAALGLATLGAVASVVLLAGAFSAVAAVDPARKAEMLARGISEAMNTTAVLIVGSWLMYAASVVLSIAGSLAPPKPVSSDPS